MPLRRTYRRRKRPTTRKYVRRTATRYNTRRTRTYKSGSTLLKCPTMFPEKFRVKLHFGTSTLNGGLTLANLGVVTHRFIMGRQWLESPVGSLSTMNPQGWDQLASVYQYYRPLGMKLNVSVRGCDPNAVKNVQVSGYWNDDNSVIGSAIAIEQNRYTTNRTLTANNNFYKSTFARPWTQLSLTKAQYMNDSAWLHAVSVNPIAPVVYYLQVRNSSGVNYVYALQAEGDLYVEFSRVNTLLDS